ncbi:MAG: cation diffusion facilitator family transporter, partial [Hyphomonadaceae bacterium]
MHGGHAHHHGAHGADDHAHAHDALRLGGRYSIAIALNIAFVILEAIAGFWTNSTALLADAGHNLSDVLALMLAGFAAWLLNRAASARRTYGFGKAPVLAALANALLLVGASGAIAWEALRRIQDAPAIESLTVAAVAAAGVLLNGGTALLFLRGRKNDVNARAAFQHMAADAAVSAGVIVSALLIWRTGLNWLDPAVTLVIVVVIALGAWDLLRESLDLALDAAPRGLDIAA